MPVLTCVQRRSAACSACPTLRGLRGWAPALRGASAGERRGGTWRASFTLPWHGEGRPAVRPGGVGWIVFVSGSVLPEVEAAAPHPAFVPSPHPALRDAVLRRVTPPRRFAATLAIEVRVDPGSALRHGRAFPGHPRPCCSPGFDRSPVIASVSEAIQTSGPGTSGKGWIASSPDGSSQ